MAKPSTMKATMTDAAVAWDSPTGSTLGANIMQIVPRYPDEMENAVIRTRYAASEFKST